jgi:Na+/melibiose symporter-like transporter
MLADAIDRDPRDADGARSGGYFGLWNLVTKLNLALAAGLALPLLSLLGYVPGNGKGLAALAAVYALLPVALKVLAAGLLWHRRTAFE